MGRFKKIAKFVANLEFDDLPPKVISYAKNCIMDTLCSMIVGFGVDKRTDSGWRILKFLRTQGGNKESTVIRYGDKLPCSLATFVNSVMAFGLSDFHNKSSIHIGGIVIPSALAISEKEHLSGRELITAVVVGYEVLARVGMALDPRYLYTRGFYPSSICGAFGAAAAVSKALGLDQFQIHNALALSGIFGGGLLSAIVTNSTSLLIQYGKAAANGVFAALLAKEGIVGSKEIFEREKGFYDVFSGKPNLSNLTKNLGKKFEITYTSIKPYSCCKHLCPAVDALLEIFQTESINKEDIENVLVRMSTAGRTMVDINKFPRDTLNLSACARYVLAMAIIDRHISPKQFSVKRLRDPIISNLAKKVQTVADPGIDMLYPERIAAVVEIKTKSGHVYRKRIDFAKGDPENPLTDGELKMKFMEFVSPVMGRSKAKEAINLLNNLEKLDDVVELVELLAK